jgi:hypothetical protein
MEFPVIPASESVVRRSHQEVYSCRQPPKEPFLGTNGPKTEDDRPKRSSLPDSERYIPEWFHVERTGRIHASTGKNRFGDQHRSNVDPPSGMGRVQCFTSNNGGLSGSTRNDGSKWRIFDFGYNPAEYQGNLEVFGMILAQSEKAIGGENLRQRDDYQTDFRSSPTSNRAARCFVPTRIEVEMCLYLRVSG